MHNSKMIKPHSWSLNPRFIYNNLKIKHKFFVIHFITILIICSVSLVAFQVTLNIYEGTLYNEASKVVNLSTISVENELKQFENFSFNIISNSKIQDNLIQLRSSVSGYRREKVRYNITEYLWTLLLERNITSINIFDSQGVQYVGGSFIPQKRARQIINKAAVHKGAVVFMEPTDSDPSLVCARQIRVINNLSLEPLGTLIIRINTDRFIKQYTSGSSDKNVDLLILSGKKEIYSSSPLFKRFGASFNFDGNNGYYVKKIDGKNYFIVYTRSTFTHWIYVNVLPFETVFKQTILLRSILLLIFLVLFLFTIFLSMRLAHHLTRPIENLTSKMKQVQQGNFDILPEFTVNPSRADEIGDLQKDFEIMVNKINTLIKEDYTKQILIKDAQMKALQAQINPHFLYNTLESINWLAKVNNQKDISQMVESLGHLLRSTISDKSQMVTLEEEIQLLENYILIQKYRFGDRLDFQLKVDEKWKKMLIPKLTLQPIVENSIQYGLEKMVDTCRIVVKTIDEADNIQIVIEDNGPGVSADILEKLKTGKISPKGLGVGLTNIDDRIKLIYGEQYRITLSSEPGKGTQVIVKIPKNTGDNHA